MCLRAMFECPFVMSRLLSPFCNCHRYGRLLRTFALVLGGAILASCSSVGSLKSAQVKQQLALDEPPYFPVCVATESGTYRERLYERQMWWPFPNPAVSDAPIDDGCITTRP